ncbi:MAG TPA: hypothetical protein HPQ04_13065 [Rhodospirillaceae bacterium]|nr:hypothetical protein [Rhodospirillaceae bacterium]
MDMEPYLRALLALVGVLGLITGGAWIARKTGLGSGRLGARGKRRLSIVETMALDGRRRLVLVRRDEAEHLLLIGGGADLVIESARVEPS